MLCVCVCVCVTKQTEIDIVNLMVVLTSFFQGFQNHCSCTQDEDADIPNRTYISWKSQTHTHTHIQEYCTQVHMHTIFMRGCDFDVLNFGNLEGLMHTSVVWHTMMWSKTHWSGLIHTDVVWHALVWSDTHWCVLTLDKKQRRGVIASRALRPV